MSATPGRKATLSVGLVPGVAYGTEGCVRMHELAEQVHLTQSALSRLITRLEKAGLVSRGVCEDDRRAIWTQITPAGTSYEAARPTHRTILSELRGG